MLKYLCAGMLVSASCSAALAATFTVNGGTGSSTVGAGGDYATLADAAADFNGAQAVTGNYAFLITSDLTEPANVGFAKATNGFTVTLKPAALTSATITFTSLADNAGPSGHIVVGSVPTAWSNVQTDNFVIDGSNNGTDSRNLTITNGTGTVVGSRLIRNAGSANNLTVKNCTLWQKSAGTVYAIDIGVRAGFGPDNALIENNDIYCTGLGANQAIQTSLSTATAGVTVTNLTVRNNSIWARSRGIFLNGSSSTVIERNKITLVRPETGFQIDGIWHLGSNSANNYTITIDGNEFDLNSGETGSTTAKGVIAINLAGASATATMTYNVRNNVLGKWNFTAPAWAATFNVVNYRAISLGSTSSGITYNVDYNSIYMPAVSFPTKSAFNNMAMGTASSALAGTTNFRNNIVRLEHDSIPCLTMMSTAGTLVSNYNVFSRSGANFTARYGATNYTTLADWQAVAGARDANSQDINPFTTTGAAWDADLRFVPTSAKPAELQNGTPIAGITTDVDGELRHASLPYRGADEAPVALPVSMSGFSID